MPRYFITTNASRNYTAGGISFPFEPIALRGGSWLGVLAVEEDSAANILLNAGFPQVAEVGLERYEILKKKLPAPPIVSPTLPSDSKPVGPGVAGVVGQSSGPGARSGPDLSRDPNSTAGITSVSLLGGAVTPPREPLLEQTSARRVRPLRTR